MTGEELKECRERLGLTQEQLAQEIGVHVMTVSRWERGARKIQTPVEKLVREIVRREKVGRPETFPLT
jgi:transcriptional regulator with XRE-family HTH domain